MLWVLQGASPNGKMVRVLQGASPNGKMVRVLQGASPNGKMVRVRAIVQHSFLHARMINYSRITIFHGLWARHPLMVMLATVTGDREPLQVWNPLIWLYICRVI